MEGCAAPIFNRQTHRSRGLPMKRCYRWFGLALAFLSSFGIVLIPATPSYAAAGLPQRAMVDILRDPAMLARVQTSNPDLYARLMAQAGGVRARVSLQEWNQLRRLGAIEVGASK